MSDTPSADSTVGSWKTIQQAGFWPFVLKFGLLGWGIPVALAVTAWDWYEGAPFADLGVPLAIRLVVFGLLGGIAFGATMWRYLTGMYGPAPSQHAANPHEAS